MSSRWIKIDTAITEHWIFSNAEYFKWWFDLLSMAAWRDHKVMHDTHLFTLERGQIIASVSFLTERWNRSKPTIIKYLQLLEKEDMIHRSTLYGKIAIITICNYGSYQAVIDTTLDTTLDTNSRIYRKDRYNSRLLFEDKSSHNNLPLSSAREDFDEAQNCDDKQIENEQAKKRVARFVPPTIEEVQNYIAEKNYEDYVSADYFINFHESKGWMIGKNKMKDWRAAVRTWVLRAKEQQKEKRQKQTLDVNSEWR